MKLTREQEAGKLYSQGLHAVTTGGHELSMIAGHLILMIDGVKGRFDGRLWPLRELSDGSIRPLNRFYDYLLLPARDGLGLPSLYFLRQTLEATPEDGNRALSLVRSELESEGINFDAEADQKRNAMLAKGDAPTREEHPGGRGKKTSDNISSFGTSRAYLAARLARDRPDLSARTSLPKDDILSLTVRAAAIEAGIIKKPTPLETIRKDWRKLSHSEREQFLAEIGR